MKNAFNIIIVLICVTAAVAQVPGYQGKRLYLGYTNDFSMATWQPNSAGKTALSGSLKYDSYGIVSSRTEGAFAMNMTHKLSLNYVTTRNSMIAFDLKYLKSGGLLPEYYYTYYDQFQTVSLAIPELFTKMSGIGFDVQYRINREGLAPFGKYAGYYFGMAFMNSSIPDSIYYAYDMFMSIYVSRITWQKTKFTNVSLGYVYGKQNIFWDKIIVDRGLSVDLLGLMVAALKDPADNTEGLQGQEALDNFYFTSLKRRVQWRNCLSMYIGVKYLLK